MWTSWYFQSHGWRWDSFEPLNFFNFSDQFLFWFIFLRLWSLCYISLPPNVDLLHFLFDFAGLHSKFANQTFLKETLQTWAIFISFRLTFAQFVRRKTLAGLIFLEIIHPYKRLQHKHLFIWNQNWQRHHFQQQKMFLTWTRSFCPCPSNTPAAPEPSRWFVAPGGFPSLLFE